jgi:adenylate cyclase
MVLNYLRRYWLPLSAGMLLTGLFALHAVHLIDLPFVRQMEYLAYDLRLQLTMPRDVDHRLAIVDVDERSLAAGGRWPWPRDHLARLVDNLFDHYRVAVVGFDMVFAEADEDRVLQRLEPLLRGFDDSQAVELRQVLDPLRDEAFASSLRERDTVLGYYFSHDPTQLQGTGQLPDPMLPAEIAGALGIEPIEGFGYGANLPVLQQAARAGGFFDNVLSDDDGVFRRAPVLQSHRGALYDSLALAIASAFLDEPLQIGQENEWLFLGSRGIPLDEQFAALIPYRGGQGSFPYLSAIDVLRKAVPVESLEGRIVIVGTTAPGLYDLRNTPVQKVYPGVEIHANIVSGILDGRFLQQPHYTVAIEVMVLLLVGVLLTVLMPALSPVLAATSSLLTLLAVTVINVYLWIEQALVVPLAGSALLVLALFVSNMSYGFLTEARTKRNLTRRFGQYIPPELVSEMAANPDSYSLHGERRELTVLFSDVRGFTGIAEKLDPVELSGLMNELLTAMTRVIHDHRGTIDKYMGDAIMAFWGAPIQDPEHATKAVTAALEMQRTLSGLRTKFVRLGWPDIQMGIGINTGPMNVGNMGSEFRMAYTVLGDAVNLGSRLEGLSKQYGVGIVVSESTSAAAEGVLFRELDLVRVKGRDSPLHIFEPLGLDNTLTARQVHQLAAYNDALAAYRAGGWERADELFAELVVEQAETPLLALYRSRISYFRENPPPDGWDGVFTHVTK